MPKNWRSTSVAAPVRGGQCAGIIGVGRGHQERAPGRIAGRFRVAIVGPADGGHRAPEVVGVLPHLVGDSASAWAMFNSANRRACCHRSRPRPLTISRVVRFQFEPPPGQKRAMSLSSESGSARGRARRRAPSPRCIRGHSAALEQVEEGAGLAPRTGAPWSQGERRDMGPAGE